MKMSIRSTFSTAIIAGLLLATAPMVAMEQGARQSQESKPAATPFSAPLRTLRENLINPLKDKLPNFEAGAQNFEKNLDANLRDYAKSAVGPMIFALGFGVLGLIICHNLSSDTSGVSILDKALGLLTTVFGGDAVIERSKKGVRSLKEDGTYGNIITGLEQARTAQGFANFTEQKCKEAEEGIDGYLNDAKQQVSGLWELLRKPVVALNDFIFGSNSADNKNTTSASQTSSEQQKTAANSNNNNNNNASHKSRASAHTSPERNGASSSEQSKTGTGEDDDFPRQGAFTKTFATSKDAKEEAKK